MLTAEAEVIWGVLDNLNTPVFGALYQTLSPEEARRIARKLEFQDTPKHGSWLNMAEMEFTVHSATTLNRRLIASGENMITPANMLFPVAYRHSTSIAYGSLSRRPPALSAHFGPWAAPATVVISDCRGPGKLGKPTRGLGIDSFLSGH